MAHVLAIEPDIRQAAIVKRIIREKVFADVTVVDSRDAALEAINAGVPDVLLLSALLSPRDEDELIAHLRTLGGAQHVQTHTIPQLASTLDSDSKKGAGRGLLSAFRRKKGAAAAPTGCDPDLFAEEVRTYLQSAEDKKRELENSDRTAPRDIRPARVEPSASFSAPGSAANQPIGEPITTASSWDSPFEWKPSNPSALISQPYSRIAESEGDTAAPLTADPETPLANLEPLITQSDSLLADPAPLAAREEPAVSYDEPVVSYSEPVVTYEEPLVARDELAYAASEPEIALAATAHEPAVVPSHQIDLDSFPELTLVDEPGLDVPEPVHARAPERRRALETVIDLDAIPAEELDETPGHLEPAYSHASASATRTSEPDDRQSRSGIQDDGTAIRIRGLGPLANWVRIEGARQGEATPSDDLRMLLGALAVPTAVAGVRYPRGVRIRRVRVLASQATESGESVGPVILSKKTLAERRDQAGA